MRWIQYIIYNAFLRISTRKSLLLLNLFNEINEGLVIKKHKLNTNEIIERIKSQKNKKIVERKFCEKNE